jgi:hypothetical protein
LESAAYHFKTKIFVASLWQNNKLISIFHLKKVPSARIKRGGKREQNRLFAIKKFENDLKFRESEVVYIILKLMTLT